MHMIHIPSCCMRTINLLSLVQYTLPSHIWHCSCMCTVTRNHMYIYMHEHVAYLCIDVVPFSGLHLTIDHATNFLATRSTYLKRLWHKFGKRVLFDNVILRNTIQPKLLRIKYFVVLPNSAQKQIFTDWQNFCGHVRLQPFIASVMSFKFCGRKFSWPYSNPRNLWKKFQPRKF